MIAKLHLCKIAKLHDDFKLNSDVIMYECKNDCKVICYNDWMIF